MRVCRGGGGGRHDPPIHVHFLIDFDYCVYHFRSVPYSVSYFWVYFQRPFSDITPKSLSCSFSTCLLTGSLLPKRINYKLSFSCFSLGNGTVLEQLHIYPLLVSVVLVLIYLEFLH